MKNLNLINSKKLWSLLFGVILIPMCVSAQSVNTKYRIKLTNSDLYLGDNGNGANAAALVSSDDADPKQIWYLLETETADVYFLKNDAGSYLGRDPGDNWWRTKVFSDEPGTGFNQWTVTQVDATSKYTIANEAIGSGSMGMDNATEDSWVFANKSGSLAEWEFEPVAENFISWDGTAWSNTTGPSSTEDALINGAMTVTSDLTVNNLVVTNTGTMSINTGTIKVNGIWDNQGSITVESGASFITNEAGNSFGSITVKRNSSFADADLQYSFIGSPVADFDIADLGAGYHYTYKTSDDTYSEFTGNMTAGVGYTSAGKQALEFTGVPNSGTVNLTLDNSGNQFNFVANPYAAAINRSAFVAANTNITGAIYLWDDGGSDNGQRPQTDFVTVTNAGNVSGGSGQSGATFNDHIGTAQGFIVQGSAAGDVTFTEDMRVSGNNGDEAYFREASQLHKFKIELANSSHSDELMIAFSEKGTEGFDRMWDANKFPVQDKELSISSLLNEKNELAIQTLPALMENEFELEVKLQIFAKTSGEYQVSLKDESMPEMVHYSLVDESGTAYDLSESVTLSLDNQTLRNFTLKVARIAEVLGANPVENIRVYTNSGELNLYLPGTSAQMSIAVYDMNGRLHLMDQIKTDNAGYAKIPFAPKRSGIYVVSLFQGTKQYAVKFYSK